MIQIIKISYKYFIKYILFLFDPSFIHDFCLKIAQYISNHKFLQNILKSILVKKYSSLSQTIDGIIYKYPCSIAAGFDKDAQMINMADSLGVGFHTIGSITAYAYGGNPKPWLVRLLSDQAILVNFGLKSKGVDITIQNITNKKTNIPLRISIAKTNNKNNCNIKEAIQDYIYSIRQLEKANIGDVYEINISCPNAFGGEDFIHHPGYIDQLLGQIQISNKSNKPVYIKLGLELEDDILYDIIDKIQKYKINGIIIGNLLKDRNKLSVSTQSIITNHKGGVSGKPCLKKMLEQIQKARKYAGAGITIVACGGIFDAEDAYLALSCGANLIQLITGMIYEGPQIFADINNKLNKKIYSLGLKNISQIRENIYYK